MSILSKISLWQVSFHMGRVRVWLPLPLYVFIDALESARDLCELILPRFGLPNYAGLIVGALRALTEGTLVHVETSDVNIKIGRLSA